MKTKRASTPCQRAVPGILGRTHELVVGTSKRIYDMTTHSYGPTTGTGRSLQANRTSSTPASRTVTTQDGVYLTTRLSLADPLKLILGGRLDWYDYDNRDGSGDYKVTRNPHRATRPDLRPGRSSLGLRQLQRYLYAAEFQGHPPVPRSSRSSARTTRSASRANTSTAR
jgi:outer membrane receptor protein involved in Fe transport